MHIEKNIVDRIHGSLLDISGKTKDPSNAWYGLKDVGIRKNLYPKDTNDSKGTMFLIACFSMTNGEKSIFCGIKRQQSFLMVVPPIFLGLFIWMKENCTIIKPMMLISCYITCFQYKLKAFFHIMWLFL